MLLGEVIETLYLLLNTDGNDDGDGGVVISRVELGEFMVGLTKIGRFSLNKRFLSRKQMAQAQEIVSSLQSSGNMDEQGIQKLVAEYSS